jgi:hypothetical protein
VGEAGFAPVGEPSTHSELLVKRPSTVGPWRRWWAAKELRRVRLIPPTTAPLHSTLRCVTARTLVPPGEPPRDRGSVPGSTGEPCGRWCVRAAVDRPWQHSHRPCVGGVVSTEAEETFPDVGERAARSPGLAPLTMAPIRRHGRSLPSAPTTRHQLRPSLLCPRLCACFLLSPFWVVSRERVKLYL